MSKIKDNKLYPVGSLTKTIDWHNGFPLSEDLYGGKVALFLQSASNDYLEVEEYSIEIPYGTPGLLILDYISEPYDEEIDNLNFIPEYKVLFKERTYWVQTDLIVLMKKVGQQ